MQHTNFKCIDTFSIKLSTDIMETRMKIKSLVNVDCLIGNERSCSAMRSIKCNIFMERYDAFEKGFFSDIVTCNVKWSLDKYPLLCGILRKSLDN